MKALIFDCDGVLADTEQFGHLPAFNRMFSEFNLPVQWSEAEYGEKLKIAGGKERILSLLTPSFIAQAGLPEDPDRLQELVMQWHRRKTEIYKEMVREGKLPGRPGVRRIVQEANEAGWKLGVASTSAVESVESVLHFALGDELAVLFTVCAGDMVPRKKPAPDIYLLALEKMGLSAEEALVVEDSRNGLLAATTANLRCVVTLSSYTWNEDMTEATLVVSDLGEPNQPARVVRNPLQISIGDYITLQNLEACF